MSLETKAGLSVSLFLFLVYALFPPGSKNYNVVSHIAITLSILEDGTFNINKYHQATGDKALYQGDYYSNKAPGLAFTALPITAVTRWLMGLVGMGENLIASGRTLTRSFSAVVFISRVFTVGLAGASLVLGLYFVALRLRASLTGSLFAMVSLGLATPVWGWSTMLFAHVLSAACLFLGFAILFYLDGQKDGGRVDGLWGFVSGGLLGWAITVEYTSAPAAAIILVYFLLTSRRWQRSRFSRIFTRAAIGGVLAVLPLFYYNYFAFDSPLETGYHYVYQIEGHDAGFLGFTYPDPTILAQLLVSPYRGIFWYAPVLIASLPALVLLWRTERHRHLAMIVTSIGLYYVLMNASYWYWHGGWSTGPRFLTPMLPFLSLPLAILWTRLRSLTMKAALLALFTISFIISFLTAVVQMSVSIDIANPLVDSIIPSFLDGEVRTLLGEVGISGHLGLLPLYLSLGSICFIILRVIQQQKVNG